MHKQVRVPKTLMRASPIVLACCVFVPSVGAQTTNVDRVDVVDYGLYTATVTVSDTKSVLNNRLVNNINHIATADRIPAQSGVDFGLRYKVIGPPDGTPVTIMEVITFPPQGLNSPTKGVIHDVHIPLTVNVGTAQLIGYGLTDPWEFVPGVWTFELWFGDIRLTSKSFTVVPQP
jgi:hypothetical protein